MDFGRLAYKRLDELEHAIEARRTQRVRNQGFSSYPRFPLRVDNPYTMAVASGNGSMSLMIKLRARVENIGRVSVFVDDNLLGFSEFESTGLNEQVLMLSCRFLTPSTLTLKAQNDFMGLIEGVQLMLVGDNANFSRRGRDFATDISGDFVGAITSLNERLSLHRMSVGGGNVHSFEIGSGSVSDICGDNAGGFFISYIDNSRNFWLVHFNAAGGIRRLRLGDAACESVAINLSGDSVSVVYVVKGRVFIRTARQDFSSVSSEDTLENERAAEVDFVKGASPAMLLFTREGRIFARTAIDIHATKSMNISVSPTVTASIEEI